MDNRTKERKPPDKGRVKMKPPNGLKAMPKELAFSAIQNGTQRLASQLRDAGEREERSDYGGERIESAATDGARLAARSVEAFLKSGAAALSRKRELEPPPDDLPFDETSPQETTPGTDAASVTEELPSAEHPTLPKHAENPALLEHPVSPEAAGTEPAFVSEQSPSAGQPPLPEHSDFPEKVTPTETPVAEESQTESRSRRRSRHEEEPVQTEQSEESWRPAYQDATPTASVRPVTVIVKKSGGAARKDSGCVPRGREGGALRARNADRTAKTLAGNDAPPLLKGHGAREAAALPPPAGQSAAAEYGRRKLIQERGRELTAKRADIPLSEGNAPAEPLQFPASGAEYPATKMPESPVTRTETPSPNLSNAFPQRTDVGDSRVSVKTKENPPLAGQPNADKELVKEREPLLSAPRSGSAPTGGNATNVTPNGGVTSEPESAPKAPQTGRVGVKTREASGYRTASSGADTAQKTAVQGKQKAVREMAERVAERRTDAVSVKQESVSVPPETPVPPPEESAIPVKAKGTYATWETPSADTQSAVQGKEKLIRERMGQVAGRRSDTASAGQTPSDNGKTPSPVTEQDAVPVKTKEAYAQKVTSAETQSAAQGKQKLVRERAEQVTQRRIENVSEQKPAVRADTSVAEQPAIPVKTKEASARRESSLPESQNAAQGKRKLVKERTEQIAQQRAETASAGQRQAAVGANTSAPMPQSVIPCDAKIVREGATERIPKPHADAAVKTKHVPSSAETSAPTPERLLVKTKEAYPVREARSGESRGERTLIREKARQVAERRMVPASGEREPAAVTDTPKQNAAPVRPKEAYAPRKTPDAMPQTRTAVKERTAQIAERPAPSDSARPEVPELRRTVVKTKEAYIQSRGKSETEAPPSDSVSFEKSAPAASPQTERMPVKTSAQKGTVASEQPPRRQVKAVREDTAQRTDAAGVSPRIKESETTPVKTKEAYAHWQTDAPPTADKNASVQQQTAVKLREASLQISASSVVETPKETGKTVKTKDSLIQSPATAADVRSNGVPVSPEQKTESGGASGRETAPPKERTNYGANPGQRKHVAEEKRAVESKPNLKKEPLFGDTAKKAAGEPKSSTAPTDEGVKTKGAWLRQQGKDRPRERVTTEIFKGRPQTKGQPPVKVAKGLPAPKTAESFPLALPPWEPSSTGGGVSGGGTGTPTARFIREKGGISAGKIVQSSATLFPAEKKDCKLCAQRRLRKRERRARKPSGRRSAPPKRSKRRKPFCFGQPKARRKRREASK